MIPHLALHGSYAFVIFSHYESDFDFGPHMLYFLCVVVVIVMKFDDICVMGQSLLWYGPYNGAFCLVVEIFSGVFVRSDCYFLPLDMSHCLLDLLYCRSCSFFPFPSGTPLCAWPFLGGVVDLPIWNSADCYGLFVFCYFLGRPIFPFFFFHTPIDGCLLGHGCPFPVVHDCDICVSPVIEYPDPGSLWL